MAHLPPLPITFDPQPVFTMDFAQPSTDLQVKGPTNSGPDKVVMPVVWPDIASAFQTNRQAKIPADVGEAQLVSAEMLVKFFQKSKLVEDQPPSEQPVNFNVPIRSAATYELKE